jgi:hypothetical protein
MLALLSPPDASPSYAPLGGLPALMLWAWERPEDLRGLDDSIGVAFLSQTITLTGDRVALQPRRQPLRVAPGVRLMAVTRIEIAPDSPVSTAATLDRVAALIATTRTAPRVVAVQIDFDARASERDYYRTLLNAVRERLGVTPLSITALASWCVGDRWLESLPIDEAVPMLFRMGPGDELYRELAQSPRDGAAVCRGAVGVSLDEPLRVGRGNRRLYVFGPRSWTDHTIVDAQLQAGRR